MAKNYVFSPIRWFGNFHRSLGRTISAENGRSFGFGRSLVITLQSVTGIDYPKVLRKPFVLQSMVSQLFVYKNLVWSICQPRKGSTVAHFRESLWQSGDKVTFCGRFNQRCHHLEHIQYQLHLKICSNKFSVFLYLTK